MNSGSPLESSRNLSRRPNLRAGARRRGSLARPAPSARVGDAARVVRTGTREGGSCSTIVAPAGSAAWLAGAAHNNRSDTASANRRASDPADQIDRRPDDGEVEPISRADIAVIDRADVLAGTISTASTGTAHGALAKPPKERGSADRGLSLPPRNSKGAPDDFQFGLAIHLGLHG
jgi:hypothetical protein